MYLLELYLVVFIEQDTDFVDMLGLDLLRAMDYIHRLNVYHCALEPKNVLVAFDRSRSPRATKENKYNLSTLKLSNFRHAYIDDNGQIDAQGRNLTKFKNRNKAYMCANLLQILTKKDEMSTKNESEDEKIISTSIIEENDAFACGCVLAFIYTNGHHPFESQNFSITDNILQKRLSLLHTHINGNVKHRIETVWHLVGLRLPSIDQADAIVMGVPIDRWTITKAFNINSTSKASLILEQTNIFHRPSVSCMDSLLSDVMTERYKWIKSRMQAIERKVSQVKRRIKEKNYPNYEQLADDQ